MVKVEGINIWELHSKLKIGKIEKLVKEVFGKDIDIDECAGNLFVREKQTIYNKLRMLSNSSFLTIYTFINKNKFKLKNEKYFSKTQELAEKYEQLFGGEVTIKLEYRK